MYYIAVYDVGEKRVGKMLKIFRKYMHHIQNSVFEPPVAYRLPHTDLEQKCGKLQALNSL